jgi:hypothetical protein
LNTQEVLKPVGVVDRRVLHLREDGIPPGCFGLGNCPVARSAITEASASIGAKGTRRI